MAVLGSSGDTKTIWDRNNEDEVENARATFNRLRAKRYKAWRVGKDGQKTSEMTEFDPDAERMIMVPPMQGG